MELITTTHLFSELKQELIILLRQLTVNEWLTPSSIKGRSVKDLVSHLIDGSLRRLSMQRDLHFDNTKKVNVQSYSDLVNYIQQINNEWIHASRRISPTILIDLFEYAENNLIEFFKTLNPQDKAIFAVAWAGEKESENWFDIAREYTEKWHHQMQIRMALNKPLLMDLKYIKPLYETFMAGLPNLFNNSSVKAKNGDVVEVKITGKLNKTWRIEKKNDLWKTLGEIKRNSLAMVEMPEEIAWMIFTNTDRNKNKYYQYLKITGNKEVGWILLDYVTVMS